MPTVCTEEFKDGCVTTSSFKEYLVLCNKYTHDQKQGKVQSI